MNASDAAKILSALGAKKGGRARAKSLTAARRKEIAQMAARARWDKKGLGDGKPSTAPCEYEVWKL